MKRSNFYAFGAIIIVLVFVMFLFRIYEERVIVERMLDFEQAESGSQVVWEDRDSIKTFEYAFRFGNRRQGIVDMPMPPYSVTLGNKRYLLWISEKDEHATFMKPGDTGTLYDMKMSSAKKIQNLLKNAYEDFSNSEVVDQQSIIPTASQHLRLLA